MAAQRPGIQHEGRAVHRVEQCQHALDQGHRRLRVHHAGTEQQRIRPLRRLRQGFCRLGAEIAGLRLGQAHHQRLGQEQSQARRYAAACRDLQLTGAGPQRRLGGEQGSAGHGTVAAGDQHTAALVLILARRRQRDRAEQVSINGARHRAATGLSGAAVTVSPSRSMGTVKL